MKKGGESKVKGIKCKVKERENDGGGESTERVKEEE